MPGVGRRRFGSIADDLDVAKMNGESSAASSGTGGVGVSQDQLDALKQDILQEMRKEVNQMKQEIIEGRRTDCVCLSMEWKEQCQRETITNRLLNELCPLLQLSERRWDDSSFSCVTNEVLLQRLRP